MSIAGKTFSGFGLLVSLVGLGAQSPETPLKIEVQLYNYAGVTAEALARAEQETARIYRRLGVEMEWRSCPLPAEDLGQNTTCDLPAAPTKLTVRLLSNEMAHRVPVGDDFGFAQLPVKDEFGVLVNVFSDRAREMTADEGFQRVILGHLMAHELGRLLLGEDGHPAGAGIMHVPWQREELERIEHGVMFFLPEQAQRIRAQVLARAAESGSRIAVLVYNYAGVSSEVLAQTEAEAARIHQRAGIGILWINCPLTPKESDQFPVCQVPLGPTTLLLRILPQSAAERLRPQLHCFGFALTPENERFAAVANVFAHDAEALAQRCGMSAGVILGHIAAHEIGHLLLGGSSHSVNGIMHVPWKLKELEIIGEGRMAFMPAEAAAMQMNVRARFHAAQATEEVLVPRT